MNGIDIKSRVAMLDDLMALNGEVGLSEQDITVLANFLAGLGEQVREEILQYLYQGDRHNRLERFSKIAGMTGLQQSNFLKAVGIAPQQESFLRQFLDAAGVGVTEVRTHLQALVAVRKMFEEEFISPLVKLFASRGRKEK